MKIKLDPGEYMNNNEEYLNCECPTCGKRFHLKPFAVKRFKTHYCSKECFNKSKSEYMKGAGNHQYGLTREKNASYKGKKKKINRSGYVMIRDYDHPMSDKNGWVLEHRVIAEKHLLDESNSFEVNGKMYLKQEYDVHHINFDRTDNNYLNLSVVTPEEHRRLHCKLNPQLRDPNTGRFITGSVPEFIRVKRVTETARVPERKTIGAAGYDLFADIENPVYIIPGETVMISSGIAFEIPKDYFGAIYARSGLAVKQGIRPSTCVSVIDSDFRGAVGLPLYNDSDEVRIIHPGDRVAQIVFQKALIVEIELVEDLEETERGSNGFGSTGK